MELFSKAQSVCGRTVTWALEDFFGKIFEQISFYNGFWEVVIVRPTGHKEAGEEKW